jgi:hypothetical protein
MTPFFFSVVHQLNDSIRKIIDLSNNQQRQQEEPSRS